MMNEKSTVGKSFLFSILLTLSFVILFICGLELARFLYISVFGEPYEMGWFLLYLGGKIIGLAIGLFGTFVISVLLLYFDKKRGDKVAGSSYPLIRILMATYLFFILELFLLLVLINKAIPPCANCYR